MPGNGVPRVRKNHGLVDDRNGLRVLYNLILVILCAFFFPCLLPVLQTVPKRRLTFAPRMGWGTYDWEKEPPAGTGGRIWVHALSVGEVTASQPLVNQLLLDSHLTIFLSASTLSGYQTAQRLYSGHRVRLAYFPYDWLWAVRAVAAKIKPDLVLLVETDIWPNFLWEMKRRRIPVCLANLRLSDKTWRWCRRLAPVAGSLFNAFAKIAVQTEVDRRRFQALGIDPGKVCVTGNIKFDVRYDVSRDDAVAALEVNLRRFAGLKVIVAGSTHEGEETALIQSLVQVKDRHPGVLLIVAPRDPSRAGRILNLAGETHVAAHRMTRPDLADHIRPGELIVVDRFGVLMDLYRLADLAYVGGSLVSQGGHNPLEPAACGKPVIFGPDMRDFRQIAAWLLQGGGARRVDCADALTREISALLADDRALTRIGTRAFKVYLGHRGAVRRTLSCFGLAD